MHNAPPVVYPVGRFVWAACLVTGFALAGALGLVYWQTMTLHGWPQICIAWLVWCGSVVGAALRWHQEWSPQGLLVWSGEGWFLRDEAGAENPVFVRVLLDVQRFMVLAYAGRESGGLREWRTQYAVLHQASMPSFWHGFRCAVYSRPKDDSVSARRRGSHFEM